MAEVVYDQQMKTIFKKNDGLSFFELLVSISLISIISIAGLSMIQHQQKSISSIQNKLEFLKYNNQLINLLSNTDFCTCAFQGMTFNENTKSWNSFPNTIKERYNPTGCAGSGIDILKVGSIIPDSKTFSVSSFTSTNITELVSGSGVYQSYVSAQLNQLNNNAKTRTKITMPLHFALNLSDPANARRVSSCSTKEIASINTNGCSLCIQCGHHDENGPYDWRDGNLECIDVNAGFSNWSFNNTGADESTGGVRCRMEYKCL